MSSRAELHASDDNITSLEMLSNGPGRGEGPGLISRRESSSATQKITKIDVLLIFFAFCFMIYFFVCAKSADPVSSCLGCLNTTTHTRHYK